MYNQPRKDIEIVEATIQEANTLKTLYKQIYRDIEFANIRIARNTNRKRVQEHFYKERDKVYLLQQNIKTKRLTKNLICAILPKSLTKNSICAILPKSLTKNLIYFEFF